MFMHLHNGETIIYELDCPVCLSEDGIRTSTGELVQLPVTDFQRDIPTDVVIFHCDCKWTFVMLRGGSNCVIGPFYPHNGQVSKGRVMEWEQFENDYVDCFYRYQRRHVSADEHVHPFTD